MSSFVLEIDNMYQINGEELDRFVQTTKKLIEKKPQMNESNTRLKVIVPLLELLGWDINFDVETEFPIRIGSTTAKVDYALSIDGKPTVLIEAKGFDSDVTENFARQAISYGRVEEVKWAALTNGKTIHIYDTTRGKGPKECLVDKININEFMDKRSTLCLLSKESIKNKETDSIVERIRKTQNYINILNDNKEEFAEKISNILKKPADKELYKKIEEISEEILENILKEFKKTPKETKIIEKNPKQEKSWRFYSEIQRDKITGSPEDLVAVFPAREQGVEFIKKYNAWGYVKMNKKPKYLAFYIAKPYSKILYMGEFSHISKPFRNKSEIKNIEDADKDTFTPGKCIVYLKNGSLVKLSNPINCEKDGYAPQGLFYTSLRSIKNAKNTDDLRKTHLT